jgi:hypothetical protein
MYSLIRTAREVYTGVMARLLAPDQKQQWFDLTRNPEALLMEFFVGGCCFFFGAKRSTYGLTDAMWTQAQVNALVIHTHFKAGGKIPDENLELTVFLHFDDCVGQFLQVFHQRSPLAGMCQGGQTISVSQRTSG